MLDDQREKEKGGGSCDGSRCSVTNLHHLSVLQNLALLCRHIVLFRAYAAENILNPMAGAMFEGVRE